MAGPAEAAVARKVVTIVFADLVGSTALHERLDPESVRLFMDGYYAAMRGAVEAHGGRVTQLMGDGVKAVFGAPRVAEDDAIRAVRAAVEMQRAFRTLAEQHGRLVGTTGLRVAVNTGEVVASEDTEIIGDPVNVAARLQEQGKDGDVVIGESTQRLVADKVTLARVGSFTLKGRAEPVTAYRVVSLERPAGSAATPFVGRDEELRAIEAVYEAALAKPAARLAVLLGSPGLGKSRLLAEFARRLAGRASVISARCASLGGATFAPLAEALRAHLGLEAGVSGDALRAALDAVLSGEEAERARIARGVGALLAGTPASPEETFFVVRRLLAALAAKQPLLLAIDDLQWAEPLLLDFVEHLVQWGAGIPLLVLAAGRTELREARSSLTIPGGLVADVVTLGGLDAGAATRLAASVIGTGALPAAVAGRVLTASEGNPLFLGELVRMLVNDGALRREGERWILTVDLAELDIPPTIQALLAARIERLRPEERLVLERAAVVGRQFSRTAVIQLLPREAQAELDARLEALRRSELIEADAGWLLGEPALRFHHGLIRDAAYRRVLRGTRAELHARFAEWLEARAGESVEHDETIGWHLEQAHQQLRELGPLDANGRALGERAARYLAAAGRRALARDDLPPAAGLLGRALACLGDADPARAELALDCCEALLSAGEVARAAEAVAEFGRVSGDSERLSAWHTCFAGELAVLTDPGALHATAEAVAAAAAALAEAADASGEAKAHWVHALALGRLGKIGACEAALDRAQAAARHGRDRRRQNTVLAGVPPAALWGPSPVARASGRCLDVVRVLRITQDAPAVEAVALSCQAVLETLRGRAEAARRMIASSRRMVEELGITRRVLEADLFAGLIELLEGEAATAEPWLRAAFDGLREHGLGIDAAQAAALLGRALLAQGRTAEAEALSHESEALAGDDLKAAIAWRGVRAEALAARGEHADALDFASQAVAIAAATDDLLDHADARGALAVALHAAGRSREAHAEEARALELWEQKGATLLVERARRGASATAATRSPSVEPQPGPAVRRRVRPNGVTAAWERLFAALGARDLETVSALLSDIVEQVDHPTGASYGRDVALAQIQRLMRSRDTRFSFEPLATLGESLALCRSRMSASGAGGSRFDVGPYEGESIMVGEIDARGRFERVESFAPDRLADALARLYARYAERLPEGPERALAEAGARAGATLESPLDLERSVAELSPSIEYADRRMFGLEYEPGADSVMQSFRAFFELAEGVATRIDDVLGARSGALLLRGTTSGTARAGGGAFEMPFLLLTAWGADGRLTRVELFDSERVAEALARFDALSPESAPPSPVRRRVRPNAATASTARFDAAVAARDADALAALVADDLEAVHHPTGTTSGKAALVGELASELQRDFRYRSEPLASLGDALALFRVLVGGGGGSYQHLDIGAWEMEVVVLHEVDAEGRRRRTESFAADRLGGALARLYERHAELLPEGSERIRAAALARVVAGMQEHPDPERWSSVLAPDIAFADRRTLGRESERGAEAVLRAHRPLLELADGLAYRIDDVLGARSGALLLRTTNTGTLRASGGSVEIPSLLLFLMGADGRLTRVEQFDSERDAEALARFDAESGERPAPGPAARRSGPARPVRPNAATANAARLDAAIAAHDADVLPALFADSIEAIDHPAGLAYGRQGMLLNFRSLLNAREPTHRYEPVASLGDALALFHASASASGFRRGALDVGAYDFERFTLLEVDEQGRCARNESFAPNHLGDAVARLYERYAERLPDGEGRARATATARSVAKVYGPQELERYASLVAPAIELVDHRILGSHSLRGAEAALENLRSFLAVANDFELSVEQVLTLAPGALLWRATSCGTDRAYGGAFERPLLALSVFGADGLLARCDIYDVDAVDAALARWDELTAPPKGRVWRVPANAATANATRLDAALAARDTDALSALFADSYESVEHRMSLTLDRSQMLSSLRLLLSARAPRYEGVPLASLGDPLALFHVSVSAGGVADGHLDVGAFENEAIVLTEVDVQGRRTRAESFAPDRLGDAVSRLYERYAELRPDGPERARATRTARLVAGFQGPTDPSTWRGSFAPAIEFVDRRIFGVGTAQGADEVLRTTEALQELSDNLAQRIDDILGARPDALLVSSTNTGTDRTSGGVYERMHLLLFQFGADGRITRIEQLDPEREAEALARFDELTAAPARARRVRPNAATAIAARMEAAVAARDAAALADLWADSVESIDHVMAVTTDRQGRLLIQRALLSAREPTQRFEPLASLGGSLALFRVSTRALGLRSGELDVGAYEDERISLFEADEQGRIPRIETFAVDHLGDAILRLYERYAERLPDGAECARAAAAARSFATQLVVVTPDGYVGSLSPGVECVDHRILGTWSARGSEAVLQHYRAFDALAHDIKMCIGDLLGSERNALLVRGQARSTDRAGGGVFETTPMLSLVVTGSDGRLTRLELFDTDREAEALARFDELTQEPPREDPLRIPPNAASRARERTEPAFVASDWQALRALASDRFEFDDRRKLMRLTGDAELWVQSMQVVRSWAHARHASELIGTAGDRLAIERVVRAGEPDSGRFEIEFIRVTEVDADGRLVAWLNFDLDDRRAAFVEAEARFVAGEAAGVGGQAPVLAFTSALAQRNWQAVRACLADDFAHADHRTLGLGALPPKEWIGSLEAYTDLARDWSGELVRLLRWNRHGRVVLARGLGTVPGGGGPFENILICLLVTAGDRIRHVENFDVTNADRALARFEELCAGCE